MFISRYQGRCRKLLLTEGVYVDRYSKPPLAGGATDYYCYLPGSVAQSDARSTGDQEGVSSRLRSGNILSLRLIMKSFLRSFSPFR